MTYQHHAWTADELHSMQTVYPHLFGCEIEEVFPGREPKLVRQKAYDLGVRKGPRRILFPKQYDNDHDGGYVSGLVDGEGCFSASIGRRPDDGYIRCNASFDLALRADDQAILEWLAKTYLSCGSLHYVVPSGSSCPKVQFRVAALQDHLRYLVPHFDKYPLRAKKRKDYEVWRQLVQLLAENHYSGHSDEFVAEASSLVSQLRTGRRFENGYSN